MLSGDLGTRSPSESLWESDLARFVVHNSSGQLLVWRGCTPEHLTPKDAEQLLAAILDELGRSAEPVEDATCVATPFEATQGWVAERKRDKDDLRRHPRRLRDHVRMEHVPVLVLVCSTGSPHGP
jgi:hypothetical protein